MNKTELIAAVAEKAELSKKDAEKAMKAFTDVVAEELVKGEKIQSVSGEVLEFITAARHSRTTVFCTLTFIYVSAFFVKVFTQKNEVKSRFSGVWSLQENCLSRRKKGRRFLRRRPGKTQS